MHESFKHQFHDPELVSKFTRRGGGARLIRLICSITVSDVVSIDPGTQLPYRRLSRDTKTRDVQDPLKQAMSRYFV